MNRKPVVLRRSDWARDERLWHGFVEGRKIGTDVTVLFYSTEEVGKGPVLHVHPYAELFIIRTGRALYTIGDETMEAAAGDILLGPAEVPHKFVNLGPGLLETIDVHLNDRWIQTDLEPSEGARMRPPP